MAKKDQLLVIKDESIHPEKNQNTDPQWKIKLLITLARALGSQGTALQLQGELIRRYEQSHPTLERNIDAMVQKYMKMALDSQILVSPDPSGLAAQFDYYSIFNIDPNTFNTTIPKDTNAIFMSRLHDLGYDRIFDPVLVKEGTGFKYTFGIVTKPELEELLFKYPDLLARVNGLRNNLQMAINTILQEKDADGFTDYQRKLAAGHAIKSGMTIAFNGQRLLTPTVTQLLHWQQVWPEIGQKPYFSTIAETLLGLSKAQDRQSIMAYLKQLAAMGREGAYGAEKFSFTLNGKIYSPSALLSEFSQVTTHQDNSGIPDIFYFHKAVYRAKLSSQNRQFLF